MKCKYCGAELEEGTKVCPACGEVCAGGETEALEKKLKTMKIVLGAVLAAVLVAALALVLVLALKEGIAEETKESTEDASSTEESADSTEATYLDDGNEDDETCKGTYTVTSDELMEKKDVVVATCGDAKLTNSQLQIYYWSAVYDYLSEYYYYMDISKPLDTQLCSLMSDKTITWQQVCLAQALMNWQADQALAQAAVAAGFEMTQEGLDALDSMSANLEEGLAESGYASLDEMVQKEMGVCVTYDEYFRTVKETYLGYYYFDELTLDIEVTDEEIATYYEENAETLEYYYGATKDSGYLVDIRHILIMPQGGTTDSSNNTTYTEEEWDACRAEAQRILDQWLAGEMTEESFAELAKEYSKDGNAAQGGIYQNVCQGQMVETFNDWCFDESRVAGDYGIVETKFGCHIMYFSRMGEEGWIYYSRAGVQTEKAAQIYEDMVEALPMDVDYKSIVLGLVDLG